MKILKTIIKGDIPQGVGLKDSGSVGIVLVLFYQAAVFCHGQQTPHGIVGVIKNRGGSGKGFCFFGQSCRCYPG